MFYGRTELYCIFGVYSVYILILVTSVRGFYILKIRVLLGEIRLLERSYYCSQPSLALSTFIGICLVLTTCFDPCSGPSSGHATYGWRLTTCNVLVMS
jgi:hypothetical protein